jgi:hypothetical protein
VEGLVFSLKRRSDNFSTNTDKRTNRPSPLRHASSRPPRPRRSEKIFAPQPPPFLIKVGGKKFKFKTQSGNLISSHQRARPRPRVPRVRSPARTHHSHTISRRNQSANRTHLHNIRLLPHTNYNPIISNIHIIRLLPHTFPPLPLVSLSPLAHVSWRSCIKPVSYLLLSQLYPILSILSLTIKRNC